jgi:hypothetical protein
MVASAFDPHLESPAHRPEVRFRKVEVARRVENDPFSAKEGPNVDVVHQPREDPWTVFAELPRHVYQNPSTELTAERHLAHEYRPAGRTDADDFRERLLDDRSGRQAMEN